MERFMYIYLMLAIEELDIKYAREKILDEDIPDSGIIMPEVRRKADILLSTDLKIWHENYEAAARANWEKTNNIFGVDPLLITNRDFLWELERIDYFEMWMRKKYSKTLGGDEAKADSTEKE